MWCYLIVSSEITHASKVKENKHEPLINMQIFSTEFQGFKKFGWKILPQTFSKPIQWKCIM